MLPKAFCIWCITSEDNMAAEKSNVRKVFQTRLQLPAQPSSQGWPLACTGSFKLRVLKPLESFR